MLISPPFLPVSGAAQREQDWLKSAMSVATPGDGAFPVSFNLGWHGGIHLTAPTSANATERVRAISDGEVIFSRKSTKKVPDPKHPLNYRGGWTDDGCVVIRHETAIGTGENASAVIFFSIYMHLSEVHPAIQTGKRICRKDDLGEAGQIYGSLERKIHLEIVCDDVNMCKFVGRSSGNVNLSENGRSDVVYGAVYFYLPAGTEVFAERPLSHLTVAQRQRPKPAPNAPLPAPAGLMPIATTTVTQIVGIHYFPDEDSDSILGSSFTHTTFEDGASVGAAIKEVNSEYEIYSTAKRISMAFPATSRPSPSAVFELLKFGRVINSSKTMIPVVSIPNWRQIRYAEGTGWVDLNAAGITKFSDADFPQWQGWSIVDDSEDQDSRCDSPSIKKWLNEYAVANGGKCQVGQSLRSPELARKLARSICKFPSDWRSETIEKRWGWLLQKSETNLTPLDADDFADLKSHINALCFDAPLQLDALWHWNPHEFISQFRKCGWLSERELVRCIPNAYQSEQGQRGSARIVLRINDEVASQRISKRDPVIFMEVCRKYGLDRRNRMVHFLAQIFRETGVLRWDQELASGADYEGRADLGNTHIGDGVRFKGRGLIQTTGRINYEKYNTYCGRVDDSVFTLEPNNLLIATDPYCCVDAAGFYWVSRDTGSGININRLADSGVGETQLRLITRNVNGAEDGQWTGLFERRSHLAVLTAVLLDNLPQILPAAERKNV